MVPLGWLVVLGTPVVVLGTPVTGRTLQSSSLGGAFVKAVVDPPSVRV